MNHHYLVLEYTQIVNFGINIYWGPSTVVLYRTKLNYNGIVTPVLILYCSDVL